MAIVLLPLPPFWLAMVMTEATQDIYDNYLIYTTGGFCDAKSAGLSVLEKDGGPSLSGELLFNHSQRLGE